MMTQHAAPALAGRPCVGILASAAHGLPEFIQHQGGDADRILGECRIDPEQLAHPTLALNLQQYCEVFEEAARQTGHDNFGLHFGQQFLPQFLGLIGYVGICSDTLGDALSNVAASFAQHQQASLLRLSCEGDLCRLDYQVQYGPIMRKRQDAESSLGMFANLIRSALGPHWAPERVEFEHPQPEAWYEHCKAFDAPVLFARGSNALVFRRKTLNRPMPGRDPRLLALVLESIHRLGAPPLQGHARLIGEVKASIRQHLAEGAPSLEAISEHLRLPVWSIQRRLAEQGLTFSRLLDQIRRELASWYLQQSSMSLSELALVLGYSEISAFSRAFRRWFGVSPRQWRQAHKRFVPFQEPAFTGSSAATLPDNAHGYAR